MGYREIMSTEIIRKTLGKSPELTVFEQVRRLNAELARLGIRQLEDDHLVRKVFGPSRQKPNSL